MKNDCPRLLILALLILVPSAGAAKDRSVEELRRDVEFLASAELEGRMTGTDGEKQAADYIVRELKSIGARPLPGSGGFLRPFEFTAGTEDTGSSLVVEGAPDGEAESWKGSKNVRALSFTDSGSVSGAVVFAGYGLTVPDSQEFSYDSYAGLDVEDKIVLVLRYFPEDTEGDARAALARYAGLRYKALQARDRGAKALLVVTGPRSPNAGKTVDMSYDAALSGSGVVAASVGGEVAARIFEIFVEKSLEQVQESLDSGNPHATGFEIDDLTLTLDVKIKRERRTGHNVIGHLPAAGEAAGDDAGWIILGAHYDHLGRGRHGNSLARKEESGGIHLGADDNASGVAAVLAAGQRLNGLPQRPPILLAFWSGEELGLLGSNDFVKGEPETIERLTAYLNFDMVGRMREDRLNLQAVGSSSVWPGLIEKTNVVVGLDVRTQQDPYLPTDASTFYQAGIPVLNFFTGSHEDYHRPSDVPSAVNYDGVASVARFAALVVQKLGRLEEPPDFVKVERKTEATGSRDSLRAYTGTIPDYATEVDGLRLGGVADGGPADLAGLREGDVIVELAGRKIANIYDYTYALDAVKIGQPVKVKCMRDGQQLEMTITPTARP